MIPRAYKTELDKIDKQLLIELLWDISAYYAWPNHSAAAVYAQIQYQRRYVEKAIQHNANLDAPGVDTPDQPTPPPAATELLPDSPPAATPTETPPAALAPIAPPKNLLPRGGLF